MLINIDDCKGMDMKLCQLAEKNNLTDEQFVYFTKGWQALWGMIVELPSADRPQGEWIIKDKVFYCSCCDNDSAGLDEDDVYVYGVPLPNYCPHCGADMRGKK